MTEATHPTRLKLLDTSLQLIRAKGYSATTVDDVCRAAAVTKGGFFHHFSSKEDLAIAATRHWSEVTGALFDAAPYQRLGDPRDRILAYIDFRSQIVQGDLANVTCLLGTMVQETYDSHPAIRAACQAGIESHARTLEPTLAQAKALYAPNADWSPESVALYTQVALQGAFVVAKAQGDATVAISFIAHLRRYVQGLLTPTPAAQAQPDTYLDGYIMVVPQAKREAFIAHVKQSIPIYKEYGALRVLDSWADDLPGGGRINSYSHAVQLQEGEALVFSYIEWPSKAVRDAAWPRILRDPRMHPDVNPMPYDYKRMLRGGFQTIVQA
ncbi:MAG: DUF1428 family protein [Brachymonas sp.]